MGGGLFVSGAGCIANDIWDRQIDKKVSRTKERPLAKGDIRLSTAWVLMALMLILSISVVGLLPKDSQLLCFGLASISLLPIFIYPSAKRWFKYPQAILSFCWGFAVLIPWAASQSSLNGGLPLACCWGATLIWTFGFDTVYAMADREDDAKLGIYSSALSLGKNALTAVSISYLITCLLLAGSALFSKVHWPFWPIWVLVTISMQRETQILKYSNQIGADFGLHFRNQVRLGALLLFGLIIGRIG